jgi:Na+/H+-dicarboxylate symporter
MKVWVKLLIGSLIGIILGCLLPYDNQQVLKWLGWAEVLAIGIGRYTLMPILLFSLTIAVYELRQDGQFWKLVFKAFLIIIAAAVLIIPAGIFLTLIFRPARIPILIEEQLEAVSLNVADNALNLFPSNMFASIFNDGVYLLPLCVFAFFLGIGLSYDKNYTKPVTVLVDSLSRIFYHIASFFSETLGIIMIVLASYWAIRYHSVLKAEVFKDLIVRLSVFSLILGFGILPLLLYFIKPKCNPWAVLYGTLGSALTAFFSGDINFTLPVLLRNLKENSGCRRRSNVVTAVIFTIFGRAGSAMVAAAAFIVIIKSYVSLGISPEAVFSIGIRAILISFLLAAHSGNGAYTALAVLCLGYGNGYEAGYLILKPIAFYLIAIGTFLDIMIASFGSYALARINGFQEDKPIERYI